MGGRREYLQEPWSALLEAISEIVVAIALKYYDAFPWWCLKRITT